MNLVRASAWARRPRWSRLAGFGLLAALLGGVLVGGAASRTTDSSRAGTIAFIRLGAGPGFGGRLFVIRVDGRGLRGLTPPTAKVVSYAWSPDGSLIAYIDQRASLWLVRPDGSGRRLRLPASQLGSVGLSWSPDGEEIAIVSPGPSPSSRGVGCGDLALYIVAIGGGPPKRVSPPRRGIGCGVAWSPTGGAIAYGDGGEDLGVISRNGGRPRLLLTSGVGAPQWSPDGTRLAAPTVIHLGGLRTRRYSRITVVNGDGSDPRVLTDHAYTEYPFAWSPDSRQILYGRENREGIYVIDADGRRDHRVTGDAPRQALWGALGWSPDGGSIVYATDRTGPGDLYVIGADGRHKRRLTHSNASDIDPSWQPR